MCFYDRYFLGSLINKNCFEINAQEIGCSLGRDTLVRALQCRLALEREVLDDSSVVAYPDLSAAK